jgi:hypothetical protein
VTFMREVVAVASVARAAASPLTFGEEAWRDIELVRGMFPESMIRQLQSLDEGMTMHIRKTFEKGVQIAVALYVALNEEVAARYPGAGAPRGTGVPPIAEEVEPVVVQRIYGKMAALICHGIVQLNAHLCGHYHWNTSFNAEIVAKEFDFHVSRQSQAAYRAATVERDSAVV